MKEDEDDEAEVIGAKKGAMEPRSPAVKGLSSLINTALPKWADSNSQVNEKSENKMNENSADKPNEKPDTQMVLASHFSDEDSDNDEVAKVGVDEDPDFDEINFQKMIEKSKYANRYANFGNEDEARQIDNLRRSSEAWGR